MLLANEAKINLVDAQGRTALIHAALDGRINALQKLLDKGADIDIKDNQDRNVIILAASAGNSEVLKVLFQGGATTKHANEAFIHLAKDTNKNPKWNEETLAELKIAGADFHKISTDRSTGR